METIFKPKFFSILKRGIDKQQLTADVMAGVVVGIVALPLAIAFAVASGVSPEKGIITAVIAGFIISLLGGSRVQIGGPTGAFVVIVYSILTKYGADGLIISTIMAGLMLVLFGLLRLGSLLKYFPHPLIVGFTSGIALVIFSIQVKDLLGFEITEIPSEFIPKWQFYFRNMELVNPVAVVLTAITIIITVASKRFITKIPGSFFAIILITLAVALLKLDVPTIGSFFGEIGSRIEFRVPGFEFSRLRDYLQPALTIAILGGIESLLSAVVADGMISGNHRSNTELIAQGIANIVTPFFGGIPATGAIARTATNVKNGARTPVSGMVHSVTLLIIMLFFARWASLIPMSCLAGILIVVAYNMSEWRSFISILRGSVFDVIVLLTTFLLTVLVDLTVAIEIGVVLSAVLFMKRMADLGKNGIATSIDSDLIDDYRDLPRNVSVFEISGPFFFGSAREFSEVMKATGIRKRVMIIRMRHVPFIDSTGLHNFRSALTMLMGSGTMVVLSGVNSDVKADLYKGGLTAIIGESNIFSTFEEATRFATVKAEGEQESRRGDRF